MKFVPAVIVVIVIVVIVIVAIMASVVLLLAPTWLPTYLQSVGDRIALAQLLIEALGVFALLVAAYEFSKSQRRPKLQLWLQRRSGREPIGNPVQSLSENHQKVLLNGEQGYIFSFALSLENNGNAPARFVKVVLKLEDTQPESKMSLESATDSLKNRWVSAYRQDNSNWYMFRGSDDLIVYDHPKKIASLAQWLEPIGEFELSAFRSHKGKRTHSDNTSRLLNSSRRVYQV